VRLGWLIALERGRAVAFEGFAEDVWQNISDWSIWEFILWCDWDGLLRWNEGRPCSFGFTEDVWQDISDWSIWELFLVRLG